MAKRKYKLTGFARFMIVMLFLAPVAFITANYINNKDGLQEFMGLFGAAEAKEESSPAGKTPTAKKGKKLTPEEEIRMLRDSLRAKEVQIQELKREVRLLKGSSE